MADDGVLSPADGASAMNGGAITISTPIAPRIGAHVD
jgi:hypothetical protein